ncbi:MAG: hypothetical protein ACP5QO_12100, partial [Clostridia bacterium]
MLEGPSEPVELGDDQLGLVQLGAAGQLPTGLVDEDLVSTSGPKRGPLSVDVLVGGGHTPVADPHRPTVARTGEV